MQTAFIPYSDLDAQLEGFAAYQSKEKRPVVILCHSWAGRDDFICKSAQKVAEWGFVGFALDMYGKGILGKSKEENRALKMPFLKDRKLLQQRVTKAFNVASELPFVDLSRIAVLGFGFGGVCALDLARSGANLKGAISIYGHFDPPPASLINIKAKILILHGYNDPISSFAEFQHFAKEMEEAKVDWQAQFFGNTMHAFATPGAHDPDSGILYNPLSSKRAWRAVQNFCEEIFKE